MLPCSFPGQSDIPVLDLDKVPVQTGAGVGLKGIFQQVGTLSSGEVIDLIGEVVKIIKEPENLNIEIGFIKKEGSCVQIKQNSAGSVNVIVKWSFVITKTYTSAPYTVYSLKMKSLNSKNNKQEGTSINNITSYNINPTSKIIINNTGCKICFTINKDINNIDYFFNTKPTNTFIVEYFQTSQKNDDLEYSLNSSFTSESINCTSIDLNDDLYMEPPPCCPYKKDNLLNLQYYT